MALPEPPLPAPPKGGRHRYPGVRSFEEHDKTSFRGRSAATEELLLRVLSVRLLLQFAPSGVGKTSLLNAGLFPRLRPHDYFPFIVRLNLASETLTQSVRRAMLDAAKSCGLRDPVIPENEPDLWLLLAGTQLWSDDLQLLTPVLVFDQFEEVFTLRDEAFRKTFGDDIGDLAAGQRRKTGADATADGNVAAPPLKIIISLREEYLGKLEEFSTSVPSLFHERLRLPPLSAAEAREAIVEPARLPGTDWATPAFGYTPACLDFLIDFVDGLAATVRLIEPLTLQLVCQQAENLVSQRTLAAGVPTLLSESDFGGQAGLERLVRNYYLQELGKLADASTRRRARQMFEEGLLDPAGKRLMLEQGEIERMYRLDTKALRSLVASSLLRREPRNESVFYEISHDRLTDTIAKNRKLRVPRWIKATAAATLCVIFALAFLAGWAYQERQTAITARQQAEDALKLLLSENLVSRLREAGLTDALNDVLAKVQITSFGPAYALTLRHEGDLLRERATLPAARTKYEEALRVVDSLLARSEGADPELRSERARLLQRLASLQADTGEVSAAADSYATAMAEWAAVLAGDSSSPFDRLDAAEARIEQGGLRERMGRWEDAEAEYVEALKLASDVWNAASEDVQRGLADVRFEFGRAVQVYANAAQAMANLWADEPKARSALALAREALRLRPGSAQARQQYGHANVILARHLSGRGEVATTWSDEARRQFDEMAEIDPESRRLQGIRATHQIKLVEGLAICIEEQDCKKKPAPGELQQGLTTVVAAIGHLRWLAGQDPVNREWQGQVVSGLITQAKLLIASGQAPQARQVVDMALASARDNRVDKNDVEATSAIVDLLRAKATLFDSQGNAAAALSMLEEATAAMKDLPESVPKVSHYYGLLIASQKASLLAKLKRQSEVQQANAAIDELLRKLGDPWGEKSRRASALNAEGWRLREEAQRLEGAAHVDKAREALVKLKAAVLEDPFEPNYWSNLTRAHTGIAEAFSVRVAGLPAPAAAASAAAGEEAAATIALKNEWQAALGSAVASAWMARVLSPEQADTNARGDLYGARLALTMFLRDQSSGQNLLPLLEHALSDAKEMARQRPGDAYALFLLADANAALGSLRWEAHSEGWEESLRTALAFGEQTAEREPRNGDHRVWLSGWRKYLADLLKERKREEEARASYRQALADCRAGLQLIKKYRPASSTPGCLEDLKSAGYQ